MPASLSLGESEGTLSPCRGQPLSLAFDEKLIVAMIVFAVVLRWIHTAYFPFTVYDALWVYGYQGRLYFLEGNIPDIIGYYPQFVPLQFAYVQVMIGEINDHAARMVLPLMHIGSILAAYLLGQRLVNRRVGLFTAALWSLHPYVGQWAFRGDLEIPLTFSFTMAALFFLCAWRKVDDVNEGRAHAILAGVMLGIALFTKPTAGAFAWGVGLLVVVELLRSRSDAGRWLPRFKLALWTGLACLPLGVVWYLRNILLGHDAVTLPKAIWLTRALRNGDYLAPLVVALLVCFLAVILRQRLKVRDLIIGSVGVVLVLASALASNSFLSPTRVDPPASYLRLEEVSGHSCWLYAGCIQLARSDQATVLVRKQRECCTRLAAHCYWHCRTLSPSISLTAITIGWDSQLCRCSACRLRLHYR